VKQFVDADSTNYEPRLYSLSTCAAITGESLAVWRKRIFYRQIPFVKAGRNVRVRREDFDEWIRQRIVPAAK
jgi:excisionase family DNA binding protein